MIIKDVQLETVCGITSTLPKNNLAEVAFAGKSNVGKSSLINVLISRKGLARTSSQPGKTQTINFYRVTAAAMSAAQKKALAPEAASQTEEAEKKPDENVGVYFVDLPGYGYAKASVRDREQWGKLIERYLRSSAQLKTVFLLVDIRHEPGANDIQMYDWICRNGYIPVVIATKQDKIKRSQLSKQLSVIRKGLQMKPGSVLIPFSAETKQGREEIWSLISVINQDKE